MSIITTTMQLEKVCAQIDSAARFAMDLEFIPEKTYSPQLCLIQVAVGDEAYIIDPLVISDLMPLWQKVADEEIQVILHAAEQDLSLVYNHSGLIPKNIIDTQIAAGFIGYGYPIGYGKLIQNLMHVTLSKTESLTDWMARPLSESQIQYALNDVKYLLPVYDKLSQLLKKHGRTKWVFEECEHYSLPESYKQDHALDYLRVKGANGLSRRGLAILKELCDFRDQEARRINRPIKSILNDNILLDLSRRPPQKLEQIQQMRGIRPDQIRQYGDLILKATAQGMAVANEECPVWPSYKMPPKRDVLIGDIVFAVQKIACYEYNLAPELVATRNDLQNLVRLHGSDSLENAEIPLMQGWRYQLIGKVLIDLLNGAAVEIRVTEGEPPVSITIGQSVDIS